MEYSHAMEQGFTLLNAELALLHLNNILSSVIARLSIVNCHQLICMRTYMCDAHIFYTQIEQAMRSFRLKKASPLYQLSIEHN